jgi:hypothetical protein
MSKAPVARDVRFHVSFSCSRCKKTQQVEVPGYDFYEVGGGCFGHGPGEYCYCPHPEMRTSFSCPDCKGSFDVLVKEEA